MTNPISEERLRNTRAWAVARLGSLSGADVIVAAIDELLRYREIVGYELAEPAVEPSAKAMTSCRLNPVPHSVLYDVAGWLCSVCGGWNAIHRKVCHHDHSSLNRPPDPGAWVCNVCGYPNQHGAVVCENAVTHPNRSAEPK